MEDITIIHEKRVECLYLIEKGGLCSASSVFGDLDFVSFAMCAFIFFLSL